MSDRLPHPPALDGRVRSAALRRIAGSDVRATPEQLEAFRAYATVGDPLADALVAEMRALPRGEGRRLFDEALAHGLASLDAPPPALTAFFEEVETEPFWLDRDKLELAARAQTRTGVVGVYGPLPDIALIGGYLASKPDKVLVRTGDLEAKAPRRLAETANWWVEVTTPGALERGGPGYIAAVRVRLTHAHVRAAMAKRDDWDADAWDAPVNQVHTAGTLMLFSMVFTLGLRGLGFRFTSEETAAVFHFWRYVGRLMGVHPELLPATQDDTFRLAWLQAATEFIPDEDSHRLAQAMIGSVAQVHGLAGGDPLSRAAVWTLVGLHSSLTRLALGSANADILGVPNRPPFHVALAALAGANFAAETARRAIPGATWLSVKLGDRSRRAMLQHVAKTTRADLTYTREPQEIRRAA